MILYIGGPMEYKRVVKVLCKVAVGLLTLCIMIMIAVSALNVILYKWLDAFIGINVVGLSWYARAWVKAVLASEEFMRL